LESEKRETKFLSKTVLRLPKEKHRGRNTLYNRAGLKRKTITKSPSRRNVDPKKQPPTKPGVQEKTEPPRERGPGNTGKNVFG